MTLAHRIRVVLICVVLFACQEELRSLPPVFELQPYVMPDPTNAEFTVTDSAGVQLVRNGNVGVLGADLLETTVTRTIGVLDGDQEYVLNNVGDVATDDRGNVFVASRTGALIQMYDAAGSYLRTIGRKGEGPSEFRTVDHIWVTGDTIVAIDRTLRRASAFLTGDGSFLTTWSTQGQGEWIRPVARTDSSWLAELGHGIRVRWLTATDIVLPPSIPVHVFDPGSGTVGRHVYDIKMPTQFMVDSLGARRELPLFAVAPSYGFDGAGRLFLTSDSTYEISVIDQTGRPVGRIEREYVPQRVTSDAIADLIAFVDTVFARDSVLRSYDYFILNTIEVLRGQSMPSSLPPIDRILVSRDGSFWVRRADAPLPGMYRIDRFRDSRPLPIPSRWDLFSSAGRFLGTVELPPRFYPMAVHDTAVTGVQTDEYLVEYVVTHEVVVPR